MHLGMAGRDVGVLQGEAGEGRQGVHLQLQQRISLPQNGPQIVKRLAPLLQYLCTTQRPFLAFIAGQELQEQSGGFLSACSTVSFSQVKEIARNFFGRAL